MASDEKKPAAAAAAQPKAQVDADGHIIVTDGFDDDGKRFPLPKTNNMIALFYPQNLNLFSAFILLMLVAWHFVSFYYSLPRWWFVATFLFWRTLYNGGMGMALSYQSTKKVWVRWYQRMTADPNALSAKVLKYLAKNAVAKGQDYDVDKFPAAYNAWLVWRQGVTIVLMHDGLTYMALAAKSFHLPSEWTALVFVQYAVGLVLCFMNYWAKFDAHRCLGDYCWYWGDFFFRTNMHLTFDGIFELFPHPMYTVGYVMYYGCALICRSYTVLFAGLFAHLFQLLFLVAVEEPHIQRTYGTPSSVDQHTQAVLYDPRSGLFPQKKTTVFFYHLNPLRSTDFMLIVFTAYGLLMCFVLPDRVWTVYQVILWRCIQWLGIGGILWAQSKYQFYTQHFITRGRTLYEAFTHWKAIYNGVLTMSSVVFFGCFCRYCPTPQWSDLADPKLMACRCIGVCLILLSVWSATSCYEAVGDFGWFYGDFFIPPSQYTHTISYTGIYRFLNNPDTVTGYAGLYGLALFAQSYQLLALAMMSQGMNFLFLVLVEIPHMKSLYPQAMRADAPFERRIKQVLPKLPPAAQQKQKEIEDKIQAELKVYKHKAMTKVYEVYKDLSALKIKTLKALRVKPAAAPASDAAAGAGDGAGAGAAEHQEAKLLAPERITLGETLEVQFETSADHKETDWIGIYETDTPSQPGRSDGKWRFVPAGANGVVQFAPHFLPSRPGVYEIRYHLDNGYDMVDARPIFLDAPRARSGSGAGADADAAAAAADEPAAAAAAAAPASGKGKKKST